MNRRRIIATAAGLAVANLCPAPSRASGQTEEPPIEDEPGAEVVLEEPTEEPAVTSEDRDVSGFAGARWFRLDWYEGNGWNAHVDDDELLAIVKRDGPLAMVEAAMARADE